MALFVSKVSGDGAHFGRVIRPALPVFVATMPRPAMGTITQQGGTNESWLRLRMEEIFAL
jgi:hypothetical protein